VALALLALTQPQIQSVIMAGLEKAAAAPARYAIWFAVIAVGLNIYAWRNDGDWTTSKLGWIAYLGALSLWEELVFRVALPQTLENIGAPIWGAALLSALLFGAAHYFTLRWKWQFCVGAFVGGLALSRQFEVHNDLLLITAFHWVATFLNTPRLPGQTTNPAKFAEAT